MTPKLSASRQPLAPATAPSKSMTMVNVCAQLECSRIPRKDVSPVQLLIVMRVLRPMSVRSVSRPSCSMPITSASAQLVLVLIGKGLALLVHFLIAWSARQQRS